ncbi:DUF262 domain-containing protein [Pseudomonas syringae]|uniref:DUF262 domain-containing protein n=2 Tax=Pseudomonas syringae TaxID=317 RepID=A0A6B2B0W2_PSESX|nr:DUF262 domain-containing protein [Pseudomonas syringae]NAO44290.1 DUF262 domain-containing protein [Pseudomonas syringae]NAO49054.1 DUF262 domain-containing protein [Pseudomonas syringae]NAO62806.1 DUF262 domain-containing protein [Pseudomonas syringae]NAO67882.1 DUF262 domain-containing protein [Pseudomonas syringae]
MHMDDSNIDDNAIVDMEPEGEGLSGFEKKYKAQMRQIVTQKLDIPISTLPAMLADNIKINPEFQRRDRWDEERQSRLIESLLMNVPIPPVFLGEDDYGFYVVLDGRQRLTAIQSFLNNTLALKGLVVWDDLNGLRFNELVKRGLDKHLTRRFLSAIALLKESSPAIKYDVFDRLNTGGVKANEMEVRNAVFRGPFTDALHKLSRHPEFCKAWEIPIDPIEAQSNPIYQKMIDLSIVLRFFALSDPEKMDTTFKDFLGEFMEERNKLYVATPELAARDAERFERAVLNSINVFGTNSFRNPSKMMKGPPSLPIAEAIMIGLSDYDPALITEEIAKEIKSDFSNLCNDPDFLKSISSGTNGKGAIKTRINKARAMFRSHINKKP